jgi:hypothetical protein
VPLAEVLRLLAVEGVGDAPQDEDVELDPPLALRLLALLLLLKDRKSVILE